MKDAEIGNIIDDLYMKRFPLKLESIVLREIPPIPLLRLNFSGGITAICGANGAGKSSILEGLRSALPFDRSDHQARPHLSKGKIVAILANRQGRSFFKFDLETRQLSTTVPQGIAAVYIDAAVSAKDRQLLSRHGNIEELLQGVGARESTTKEIEAVNYVLGKEYKEILTYEIEDLDGSEDPVVPFFQVKDRQASYDTFSMGLGELAIHYFLWALRRAPAQSILLLEEPEIHVAPFSQERLFYVIAERAAEKALWTVLVTHSPAIIRRIPKEHLRLVSRLEGEVTVEIPSSIDQLNAALGIPATTELAIFVEDKRGVDVVFAILRLGGYPDLRQTEILRVGGESELRSVLEHLPRLRRVRMIGLFDGDQRDKQKFEGAVAYSFLPGSLPPEEILREVVLKSQNATAKELGVEVSRLRAILAGSAGRDDHDWFTDLATGAGVTTPELAYRLLNVATKEDPEIARQVEELLSLLWPSRSNANQVAPADLHHRGGS